MGSNCVVVNGLNLNSCVNNVPGLDGVYVLTTTGTTADISTISYDVDGKVDGFTGATSDLEWKKIDIVRNSPAALNESVAVSLASLGFDFQTQLIFTIPGLSNEGGQLYQQIVKSTQSYFIVKLKTGKFFFVSPTGMYIESATAASGSVPGDETLYTLTLTSSNTISVPEIDITTTLTAFLASATNTTIDRE
jgi:hypothetical protein